MRVDGRTDRHGEAKSRFSQFCEGAEKLTRNLARVLREVLGVCQ